jgi:hypothetical protein
MLADLIAHLIFIALMIGFLLLMLMAFEQNNKTMARGWGICDRYGNPHPDDALT